MCPPESKPALLIAGGPQVIDLHLSQQVEIRNYCLELLYSRQGGLTAPLVAELTRKVPEELFGIRSRFHCGCDAGPKRGRRYIKCCCHIVVRCREAAPMLCQ